VTDPNPNFDALLRYLRESRGFDFTGYKRSSVMRRVDRRMQEIGVGAYDEYLDYLQVHTEEFTPLFNTILINVTSFFRDPEAWEQLYAHVLPDLLDRKDGDPIRVWSAGCAAGQEAYSLAMMLSEVLGVDTFRQRVKIYATDVDEDALAQARTASYAQREVEGLSPDRLERYFESGADGRFVFTKELRRSVIFGRNDLVQDAPISRIDLMACRNTLMYFNAETQARILQRLHFALMPGGVLFLGKAETLLTQGGLFTAIDGKRRFFRKVAIGHGNLRDAFSELRPAEGGSVEQNYGRLRTEAFLAGPVPEVLIDGEGRLAMHNLAAEAMFGLTERDTGRPFQDLEISFRPAELRSRMLLAGKERRVHWLRGVQWPRAEEKTCLDVRISPLLDNGGAALGFSLAFIDVSRLSQLQDELEYANRQLETAYEELQSSNEELETTNEELQSTVEELETTNEELQSTNEELETMNQELQAMNEELQSSTTTELGHAAVLRDRNAFVEAILGSLRAGIMVISADLRVQAWSEWAQEQWGIRADEAIGMSLADLDVGLPLTEVENLVKAVLAGDGAVESEVDAVNRRGRHVRVRIRATALQAGTALDGVVLIMDTRIG
jgi:two-component system CheB/CheR fusion protein